MMLCCCFVGRCAVKEKTARTAHANRAQRGALHTHKPTRNTTKQHNTTKHNTNKKLFYLEHGVGRQVLVAEHQLVRGPLERRVGDGGALLGAQACFCWFLVVVASAGRVVKGGSVL